MTARPDQYVVIGNPVSHSKSPAIHAQFAAQTGESIAYERLAAPLDDFAACVQHFMQSGGRGAVEGAQAGRLCEQQKFSTCSTGLRYRT